MIFCGMIRIQITNMEDVEMREEIKELNNEELNEVAGGTGVVKCPGHHGCKNGNSSNACSTLTNKNATIHIVISGNTLEGIAACAGMPVDRLKESNNIKDPSSIFVGQKLKLLIGAL